MKLSLISLTILLTTCMFSQNESSKWYFAHKAALDFMTEPPTPLYNSVMICGEGSTSVADEYGNLLFYSDGSTVWNKQHLVMANGTGLLGDQTSSQSGIIIKKPGSSTVYYFFTQAAAATAGGLCYSEIDMSLAAGMGSVTVKNVLLHTPSCEKITGVKHCNGSDAWVITHDFNSADFRANLVSSAGVNTTAVVSTVGPLYNNGAWYGIMKASPSGKKIAIAHPVWGGNGSTIELYDFDKISGVVSHSLSLGPFQVATYDCEFSPDGSKLYSTLDQWDLCAGSDSAIVASHDTVAISNYSPRGLQLAINGKIYVSLGTQSLGVINKPNNPAASCNYVDASQSIAPNASGGLPNFISSLLRSPFTFTNGFACNTVSYTSPHVPTVALCSAALDPINAIEWFFGDPASGAANTSTLTQPVHQYPTNGAYKVKLVIHSGSCVADTVVQFVNVPAPPPLTVSGNFTICPGMSATITVSGANSYTWSTLSNSNTVVLNPSITTVYTVTGSHTLTSCLSTKTLSVVRSVCVGISENKAGENSIKIYPNPFQNSFSVETKTAAKVFIYNQLGMLVDTFYCKEGVNTYDATKYSNGIYILNIEINERIFHAKLVKGD
jgi:hypothetical protein